MSDLKVINLGLPKSGTTTLGEALKRADLRVADWRIRQGQSEGDHLRRQFVGKLMYEGYFETGDPLGKMPEFDAFTEIDIVRNGLNLWPQTDWGLLDAIRTRYPGAKFILTHRDAAALSDSMGRWSNLGRTRLPNNAVPGLPEGFGGNDRDRMLRRPILLLLRAPRSWLCAPKPRLIRALPTGTSAISTCAGRTSPAVTAMRRI